MRWEHSSINTFESVKNIHPCENILTNPCVTILLNKLLFQYQFGVNDPEYSGAVFSHQENRENYDTKGEYRVNLPDGRVQIVTYSAGPGGYVADVTYEGTAVYPTEFKEGYHPAPAYKAAPAPAYHA